MDLAFSSKNNRKWEKMTKTKVVRETSKWRRSEAKA